MAKAKLVIEDTGSTEEVEVYTENALSDNPSMAQKLILQLFNRIHAVAYPEKVPDTAPQGKKEGK